MRKKDSPRTIEKSSCSNEGGGVKHSVEFLEKAFKQCDDKLFKALGELNKKDQRIKELECLLTKSGKYLEVGKVTFAPTTTNSLVDELISDIRKTLNNKAVSK